MSAQESDKEADLQALYQQIDDAIFNAPQYNAKRISQITDARRAALCALQAL